MWREEQPWLSGLSLSSSQDHQCCNLEAKYFPNHMARKFKGSKNFTFTLTKKSDRFIRFFWNGPTCINTSHAIYLAAFVVWGWNFPFKISLSHVQLFTHFKTFIHFSAPHNITQELTQFNFQFSTLFKVRLGPRNVFFFCQIILTQKLSPRIFEKKSYFHFWSRSFRLAKAKGFGTVSLCYRTTGNIRAWLLPDPPLRRCSACPPCLTWAPSSSFLTGVPSYPSYPSYRATLNSIISIILVQWTPRIWGKLS